MILVEENIMIGDGPNSIIDINKSAKRKEAGR